MKNILLFVLTVCLACSSQNSMTNSAEWVSLFNGKNLNSWRNFNGEGTIGWKAEDGMMIVTGTEHTDLITKEIYENFELQLEWNISPKSNSGILFNVREGSEYGATYMTGPEYQLLDDAAYPDEKDVHLSSSNYDVHPPSKSVAKPAGQWNTTKIIVNGGHVEHWLNGIKTVDYVLYSNDWRKRKANSKWKDVESYCKFSSGHIALQDHGGEVKFRNLRIRRL